MFTKIQRRLADGLRVVGALVRSCKVNDFATNRKRIRNSLLGIKSLKSTELLSYLAPFRRYGGLTVENGQFVHTPLSFNAFARCEFRDEPDLN